MTDLETADVLSALLAPLTPEATGQWLRYDAAFDELLEARRSDDPSLPQGIWAIELKRADWPRVAAIAEQLLAERSKDVQVAAWLTEAWFHLSGFAGLARGADLLRGLCAEYWPDVHPPLGEDGDLDARIAAFVWLGSKLPVAVRLYALTSPVAGDAAHFCLSDWQHFSRHAKDAQGATAARMDEFESAKRLTPTAFFLRMAEDADRARKALGALDATLDELCGKESPGFSELHETIDAVLGFVRAAVRDRPDLAPEPEAVADPEPPAEAATGQDASLAAVEAAAATVDNATMSSDGTLESRAQAYRRLAEIADYLATTEPHSPTPYLIRRAVTWGDMTLEQLLAEFTTETSDLVTVFRLLGVRADGISGMGDVDE